MEQNRAAGSKPQMQGQSPGRPAQGTGMVIPGGGFIAFLLLLQTTLSLSGKSCFQIIAGRDFLALPCVTTQLSLPPDQLPLPGPAAKVAHPPHPPLPHRLDLWDLVQDDGGVGAGRSSTVSWTPPAKLPAVPILLLLCLAAPTLVLLSPQWSLAGHGRWRGAGENRVGGYFWLRAWSSCRFFRTSICSSVSLAQFSCAFLVVLLFTSCSLHTCSSMSSSASKFWTWKSQVLQTPWGNLCFQCWSWRCPCQVAGSLDVREEDGQACERPRVPFLGASNFLSL
jgi:hypothetical protein